MINNTRILQDDVRENNDNGCSGLISFFPICIFHEKFHEEIDKLKGNIRPIFRSLTHSMPLVVSYYKY